MGITATKIIEKAINKQHLQIIWLALAVNTIVTILIYTYFLKGNLISLIIGSSISLAISLSIILRKKEIITAQFLGIIPIITMTIYFAFVYHNLEQLQLLREFTFFYMGVFIGGGMFLLLKLKYTISIFFLSLIVNTIFYIQFSNILLTEMLFNGGVAVILMVFFMVSSIYMRHKLIVKNAISTKRLIKSKKRAKDSEVQNQILSNLSFGIPIPLSVTSICKEILFSFFSFTLISITTLPFSVNFIAFPPRLYII